MTTRPLDGLRVVDLADEKGELAGRILADFGADVIRIEPPTGAGSRRRRQRAAHTLSAIGPTASSLRTRP